MLVSSKVAKKTARVRSDLLICFCFLNKFRCLLVSYYLCQNFWFDIIDKKGLVEEMLLELVLTDRIVRMNMHVKFA